MLTTCNKLLCETILATFPAECREDLSGVSHDHKVVRYIRQDSYSNSGLVC